jgi:mono/diheme cytochrome c family protein
VISTGRAAAQAGANADAKKLKNPVAASAESIGAGEQLYKKYCRFCHGADAKGNGPQAPEGSHPPDLTDAKWDRGDSDGEIFTLIKEGAGGKSVMKAFKSKMTDQEIWNVVNYLRSLQAK